MPRLSSWWPLKANTSLHEVSGGYENELAVCEKRRYMETVRPTEQLDKDKS